MKLPIARHLVNIKRPNRCNFLMLNKLHTCKFLQGGGKLLLTFGNSAGGHTSKFLQGGGKKQSRGQTPPFDTPHAIDILCLTATLLAPPSCTSSSASLFAGIASKPWRRRCHLTKTVTPVLGLLLDCWGPPRICDDHEAASSKVNTKTSPFVFTQGNLKWESSPLAH